MRWPVCFGRLLIAVARWTQECCPMPRTNTIIFFILMRRGIQLRFCWDACVSMILWNIFSLAKVDCIQCYLCTMWWRKDLDFGKFAMELWELECLAGSCMMYLQVLIFFISCKESDIQTHVHVWGRGYCQDKNRYPRVDPWGHQLDSKRASMADQGIVPGYVYILDGMQADQDYLRAVFSLKGYVTRQVCCHLCAVEALQWTSSRPGEPNDPNKLFTVFGPQEDTGIISLQEFQRINGLTPLTLIPGFDPCRLYPDQMRVVHLALIQDLCCSVLLDLTDPDSMFQGASRDAKLLRLWEDYRLWCEQEAIGSRASRRLFTTAILRPGPRTIPDNHECDCCTLLPVLGECFLAISNGQNKTII